MIGYCVVVQPELASFRYRVSIPAAHLTSRYCYGVTGTPTFFYKDGNPALARTLRTGVVYDVVNDHFVGPRAENYRGMVAAADVVTTCSEAMRETVKRATGRDSVVIDDPYETDEQPAAVAGEFVVWTGHGANISSLKPYADLPGLRVVSNVQGSIPWTIRRETDCIAQAAVVLVTGNNAGASANRIVKALRAGRFVVTPGGVPAWEELREFCWVGDVREGVAWAMNNREEACRMITAGQAAVRERFAPETVAAKWQALFDSTSGAGTRSSPGGSA